MGLNLTIGLGFTDPPPAPAAAGVVGSGAGALRRQLRRNRDVSSAVRRLRWHGPLCSAATPQQLHRRDSLRASATASPLPCDGDGRVAPRRRGTRRGSLSAPRHPSPSPARPRRSAQPPGLMSTFGGPPPPHPQRRPFGSPAARGTAGAPPGAYDLPPALLSGVEVSALPREACSPIPRAASPGAERWRDWRQRDAAARGVVRGAAHRFCRAGQAARGQRQGAAARLEGGRLLFDSPGSAPPAPPPGAYRETPSPPPPGGKWAAQLTPQSLNCTSFLSGAVLLDAAPKPPALGPGAYDPPGRSPGGRCGGRAAPLAASLSFNPGLRGQQAAAVARRAAMASPPGRRPRSAPPRVGASPSPVPALAMGLSPIPAATDM